MNIIGTSLSFSFLFFFLSVFLFLCVKQDGKASVSASLKGGETEALERLKKFAAECQAQPKTEIKDGSRDSIYGANFSCKISPWLATGCLSPRFMFEELKKTASRYVLLSGLILIFEKGKAICSSQLQNESDQKDFMICFLCASSALLIGASLISELFLPQLRRTVLLQLIAE